MHLVKKYGSAESIRLYQYNDYTRCNTKQHSHHIWPCHFRHNALLLAVPGSLFSCTITLIITSPPPGGVQSIAISICMSVCPHTYLTNHVQYWGVTVAVAWSCLDDNAIHYVLPVLWTTSCFHATRQKQRGCDIANHSLWLARWRPYM